MFVLTTSYYINIKLLLIDIEVFFPNHYVSVALFSFIGYVVICMLQVVRPDAIMRFLILLILF